jgi:hypothetical protein
MTPKLGLSHGHGQSTIAMNRAHRRLLEDYERRRVAGSRSSVRSADHEPLGASILPLRILRLKTRALPWPSQCPAVPGEARALRRIHAMRAQVAQMIAADIA